MAATPAIAAAEPAGIRFSLHEYDHDPQATSYGLEAAEKLDVEPDGAASRWRSTQTVSSASPVRASTR